jgi:molybdopterin/thiamine biosynthesis adenylyltransferase
MYTENRPIVVVGAGGVGTPAAWALAAAGLSPLVVIDDDTVSLSNLHRQILFEESDVGKPKLDSFRRSLQERYPTIAIDTRHGRCLPETVESLLAGAAVVIDGTDNFASRFLIADACWLMGIPVIHAAAVKLRATCFVGGGTSPPCYRCLFEDLPQGPAPDCAGSGVLGPVCGFIGGVAADFAWRIVHQDSSAWGTLVSFDGRNQQWRRVPVHRRKDCALCGNDPSILTIDRARYVAASCELF